MWVPSSERPEEGLGSTRARIMDGCEPFNMGASGRAVCALSRLLSPSWTDFGRRN